MVWEMQQGLLVCSFGAISRAKREMQRPVFGMYISPKLPYGFHAAPAGRGESFGAGVEGSDGGFNALDVGKGFGEGAVGVFVEVCATVERGD